MMRPLAVSARICARRGAIHRHLGKCELLRNHALCRPALCAWRVGGRLSDIDGGYR